MKTVTSSLKQRCLMSTSHNLCNLDDLILLEDLVCVVWVTNKRHGNLFRQMASIVLSHKERVSNTAYKNLCGLVSDGSHLPSRLALKPF